jgi:hypothetical protein
MASALARVAAATARSCVPSRNLSKPVSNALNRIQPTLYSALRVNSFPASVLVRALATAVKAKKPVTRKSVSATKSTGKTSRRAKPKKKAAPKKKTPGRKRKVPTPEEKEAAKKKKSLTELKDRALTLPKLKATNTYAIFVSQTIGKGPGPTTLPERMRVVAQKYKSLSPHQIEVSVSSWLYAPSNHGLISPSN